MRADIKQYMQNMMDPAAAQTAGLHFTELLEKIKEKGIEIANVTLHVRNEDI